MLGAHGTIGLATAVIASMVTAMPAHAVELQQLLGRWSSLQRDDCQYADDSEAAPLSIRKDEIGTYISNYGWMCVVKKWTRDDDVFRGDGECASEDGDALPDETFYLTLDADDRLVQTYIDREYYYKRCPAAP